MKLMVANKYTNKDKEQGEEKRNKYHQEAEGKLLYTKHYCINKLILQLL